MPRLAAAPRSETLTPSLHSISAMSQPDCQKLTRPPMIYSAIETRSPTLYENFFRIVTKFSPVSLVLLDIHRRRPKINSLCPKKQGFVIRLF
jgi:hypothetical protein